MGIESTRPPLPAPTESLIDQRSYLNATDLATDISRRTDKTSYSIPEDGRPLTLSTRKLQIDRQATSQASLLIEYFEVNDGISGKPSIRVKVSPSNRKNRIQDSSTILSSVEFPVKTPYRGTSADKAHGRPVHSQKDKYPNVQLPEHHPHSLREATGDVSEPGYLPPPSDISSMPADSMIETAQISVDAGSPPEKTRKPSEQMGEDYAAMDLLKAPVQRRSRSLSKERITQKVLEKLAREQSPEIDLASKKGRSRRSTTASSTDGVAIAVKPRNRKSSRGQLGDDYSSATGSSNNYNRDRDSNISGLSKSSLNPKLLQTVEDVVRRLILPEIETIKRHQSIREGRSSQEPLAGDGTRAHSNADIHLPRTARLSSPKPMLSQASARDSKEKVLTKDSIPRRKHRQSSKGSIVSNILAKTESTDSIAYEKEHLPRSTASILTDVASDAPGALTMLPNDSRASLDSIDRERRERRKKRSQSHSRTTSKTNFEWQEDQRPASNMLRLPLQSGLADSELTRESILSAETDNASGLSMDASDQSSPIIREVPRSSPRDTAQRPAVQSPSKPRSRPDLHSAASERSLSTKSRQAVLSAAGFGAGSSALYGHDRINVRDQRPKSRTSLEGADAKQIFEKGTTIRRAQGGSGQQPDDQMRLSTSESTNEKGSTASLDGPGHLSTNTVLLGDATSSAHEPSIQLQDKSTAPSMQRTVFQNPIMTAQTPNQHLTTIPHPAESHVASLLDLSSLRSASNQSLPGESHFSTHSTGVTQSRSAERWAALRDRARQQSAEALAPEEILTAEEDKRANRDNHAISTSGQAPDVSQSPEKLPPYLSDGMSDDCNPSILEEHLGDEHEHRGQWPFEPTPSGRSLKSDLSIGDDFNTRDPDITRGDDVAGSGLGIAAILPPGLQSNQRRSDYGSKARMGHEKDKFAGQMYANDLNERHRVPDGARSGFEGANREVMPAPVEEDSPLSFSKAPPNLFDDPDPMQAEGSVTFGKFDMPNPVSAPVDNMLPRAHGYTDIKGISDIQSKDIMVLMDHLSSRDGQRIARDTEILFTLVRSAAEMRNSFEDMKKFVEAQNQLNMQRGEQVVDRSFAKSKSTPTRSQQFTFPRGAQSSTPTEDSPGKKRNLFQRALKGLGGRNSTDLNRMEDTLNFILEEVAALRNMQYIDRSFAQNLSGSNPNKSYKSSVEQDRDDALGAAGAGDAAPIGLRGAIDKNAVRQPLNLDAESQSLKSSEFSALDTLAHDGTDIERGALDNTRGQINRTASLAQVDDYAHAPSSPFARHKSSNSSSFGIPKVSRWSKTTASSIPTTPNYRSQRFSEQTAWSSDIPDVRNGHSGVVELGYPSPQLGTPPAADAEQGRAPSPLLPDSVISLEEAKYQANRHSLTLQHPQPRQGPTQTQRSLMETQAREYNGPSPEMIATSPQSDAFGSVPTLARINRLAANHDAQPFTSSPLSSNGREAHRGRTGIDSDPLIPGATSDVRLGQHPDYDENYPSDAHSEDFDEDTEKWIEPVPLARKQSPYSPGGLLAPIEERYSLEQTRSSISATPAQDHMSIAGERTETPQQAPRAAINGTESPVARKITGPREMPLRARMLSRG